MSTTTSAAVAELIRDASAVYQDDPVAREALDDHARRLDEPLRIAVAGMVKAGKSTLINAIIGEEIAPTDTGECTRMVTWYRHGDTPRVTMLPLDGEPRSLRVKRVDGRLVFDIGGTRAEEVERLVVDWPVKSLLGITIIDTPGIASLSGVVSARSTDFLIPQEGASQADAIIYVMRHLHEADLRFLQSFRDAAGASDAVNALAVLSRADEIGAGRIDSLVAARDIARRYRNEDTLRSLAMGVIPVAGLLAQSARTMRQAEFASLVQIAGLDRAERDKLLLSADRFIRSGGTAPGSADARSALLDRFGLFGIRLATVLILSGIADPTTLARELSRRSGLDELVRLIGNQFRVRASQLKARAALVGIETLLRQRPHVGTETLAASLERILAGAHEFRELRLLAMARTTGLPLSPELTEEAMRLIGADGLGVSERLGLPDGAPPEQVRSTALDQVRIWRTRSESPLTNRAAAEVCEAVVRSCEAILAQLQDDSGGFATARLVLGPEPGSGGGEEG
ncbi:dynamin-like GTPase family protein [Parafrigoribacterium mesophilum]|uniref:dynamin family protein n=1 Tax=Parafrigoribacterium mesophilum TaxID=433646 RepID=UPI0031FDE967